MIKLIASDMDGTVLRNGAQELPEGFTDLILRLKDCGIHFVAASGRQYQNLAACLVRFRMRFLTLQKTVPFVPMKERFSIKARSIMLLVLKLLKKLKKYLNWKLLSPARQLLMWNIKTQNFSAICTKK